MQWSKHSSLDSRNDSDKPEMIHISCSLFNRRDKRRLWQPRSLGLSSSHKRKCSHKRKWSLLWEVERLWERGWDCGLAIRILKRIETRVWVFGSLRSKFSGSSLESRYWSERNWYQKNKMAASWHEGKAWNAWFGLFWQVFQSLNSLKFKLIGAFSPNHSCSSTFSRFSPYKWWWWISHIFD